MKAKNYSKKKANSQIKAANKDVGENSFHLEDKREASIQRKPNKTGLPDQLKDGIEDLSGHSMDDVRVHYNSSKPDTVGAHAYAQGKEIHLASGQEHHLPHELGHVVQQMEGRVQPTTQVNGMPVNDNPSLEKEADLLGEKALQQKTNKNKTSDFNPTYKTVDNVKVKQLDKKKKGSKSSKSSDSDSKAPMTDEELMEEAERRYERMAATHHPKTGRKGTPKERLEKWRRDGIQEVFDRLKKGQDDRDKGGKGGGGAGGAAGAVSS